MSNDDNTADQIRGWLIDNFPLAKKRNVGVHESLLEGGIVDSLGTLEVISYLETEFGLIVTDEEMVADHFESIQSIADFVESKSRVESA